MKILMLCEFYNENNEFQENLLAKYYIKHNHQVTIITSTFESVFDYYSDNHDKNAPSREYYDNGAKIIKLQYTFNILNRLRRYKSILSILKSEKPDLIYIHDIMLNMLEAVKYKKRNPGCKIIMDYHADYSNSANSWLSLNILHKIIRKAYLDRAKKHISKIFPVVPASAVFLNEVYKVPHEKMELLPLGADTELGKEVRRKREGAKIRKKFNVAKNHLAIFTGGKLTPTKKTELLIEAVLKLADPCLHLFIIGDSSKEEKHYKRKLQKLSAGNDRIYFIGWLKNDEIYKYLDACDLAIFPASQSIMWQQAISMGLPLIVGDTGYQSISYLNEYGNIMILKKDKITSDNICQNILKLMNDKFLFHKMKNGAIKITEEMLNWDKLIMKTLLIS